MPFETRQGAYIARTHPAPLLVKSSETSFSPHQIDSKTDSKTNDYQRLPANTSEHKYSLTQPEKGIEEHEKTAKIKSLKDLCLQAFWYEIPIDLAYASWPCIHVVAWLLRAKLCAIIDQHKLLILDVYNYVRLTIAVDIPNFTGDGS